MKLWMKIFICSFLIFESVFNIGGVILIEYGFNQSLKREVNSGLNEQLTMHSGLQTTGDILVSTYGFDNSFFKDFLGTYFKNYLEYYVNNNVYAEIRNLDNGIVYSNFPIKDINNQEESKAIISTEREHIIKKDGNSYLFITDLLRVAKQDFIQSLTHEMKTPLTSIIGYAELLRDIKYNEINNIKGMNYIHSEAKRLERLSSKLMDLILLDKKNINLKEEDIQNVYMEIDELIKKKAEAKNITLNLNINSFKVIIEKDLFKVLITNLVDNAIKASSSGAIISIRSYKNKEGKFTFIVEDYGIGIAQVDVERIFEPFYMVDKSRTKSNNGAGLGLSICSNIVDLHDGKINIISKIGHGTTISIIIP